MSRVVFNYITGTNGDDTLVGGHGVSPDHIMGLGGNDLITASDHFTLAYGGTGNDTITGGKADDQLYGDNGNDSLSGGNGSDQLYGGKDNDWLHGDAGKDHVYGGNGADHVYGDAGNDTVDGGAGNDVVNGGEGNDVMYGGLGDDTVNDYYGVGTPGNDTLYGGAGSDWVWGQGHDMVYGGAGNDWVSATDGDSTIYGEAGDDNMSSAHGHFTLYGGAGNDTIRGVEMYGDHTDSSDTIYGGAGNDSITGGWCSDTIYGGAGNDTITGGNDNDVINGGAGDDLLVGVALGRLSDPEQANWHTYQTMTGGAGHDTFSFNLDYYADYQGTPLQSEMARDFTITDFNVHQDSLAIDLDVFHVTQWGGYHQDFEATIDHSGGMQAIDGVSFIDYHGVASTQLSIVPVDGGTTFTITLVGVDAQEWQQVHFTGA